MIPGIESIPLDPRELFAAVLVGSILLLLFLDRDKIERHYFLFYRRTERGIELLDNIANRSKRFWKTYGWLGVGTGLLSMVGGFALFGASITQMLMERSTENGPSLLLPGLGSEATIQSGVSFIPFEYWIISIGILMVVHEASHGIVARANDFELNSVGWVVMGIIPGAFVEPKGENMLPGEGGGEESSGGMWEQGTWKQRLQVLGAGSFANYLTALVFIAGWFALFSVATMPSDVFYNAEDGYPAAGAGMDNGTLIEINGERIENVSDVMGVSESLEVNETVTVWSSEGNFTFQAGEKEGVESGYIGVRVGQSNVVKDSYSEHQGAIQWSVSLLYTVAMLNFLIGLFNMMPFKPLDGGMILETLVEHYDESKLEYVDRFSLIGWSVVLGSLIISITANVI